MTIREIAERAGVSPATVSLVLNDKPGVGQKKREEIKSLLESLGYNLDGKRLLRNRKGTLLFLKIIKDGMLIEQNAGFISTIMDSIQKKCTQYNYSLQVMSVTYENLDEIEYIEKMKIDGIFVIGSELDQSNYDIIKKLNKPFIVIDNSMPLLPCNSITMNNVEMVYHAIEYLLKWGDKDFGYFKSNFPSQNFFERSQGVKLATEAFSLNYSSDKEFLFTPSLKDSYLEMRSYLEKGRYIPRIVFADNDVIALGAIKALEMYGYSIPKEVSIIGFDDIYLAESSNPTLTTVHVQRNMIGQMAAVTLINNIRETTPAYYKTTVGGTLIVRESTRNTHRLDE